MKPWPWALFALAVMGPAGAAEGDLVITRAGSRPVVSAPATNFTGQVHVVRLYAPTGADGASAGKVSFMPGARTHWHTHPLGQTLIVTAGAGLVQREGGPVVPIREGDVVRIPPNVRHWHGAAPDSAMTHVAIQESQGGSTVTRMEAVTRVQYERKSASLARMETADRVDRHRRSFAQAPALGAFDVILDEVACELSDGPRKTALRPWVRASHRLDSAIMRRPRL